MTESGGGPLFEEDARRVLDYARPRAKYIPKRPPMVSIWLGLIGWPLLLSGFVPASEMAPALLGSLACALAVLMGHAERSIAKDREIPRQSWPIVGVTLGWAGLAFVGFFFSLSLFLPKHRGPNAVKCESNLRQIGQGIMLYAYDNKGAFPATADLLISRCDLNPEVFVCPSSLDDKADGQTPEEVIANFKKPGHCSYVYLGAGLTDKTVLPDMILAHEKPGYHDGMGMNFLFGDFHVEWIKQREADRILAELKAGHNPPRPKNGGGR